MKAKSYLVASSLICLLGSMSCKKKESTTESSNSGNIESASLEDLNLSQALAIDLPDTLAGTGASLSLVSAKSEEACRVNSTIKEGKEAIDNVGNMFCHFEAENDKISEGVKYLVTFKGGMSEGGADSFQIWIDNSKMSEGVVVVNFCEDYKMKELITLTGVKKDQGSKGTLISVGSDEGEGGGTQSWKRSIAFDNKFTDKDRVSLSSKDKFSSTGGASDGSFARMLVLDLLDDGVSSALVSENGTWGGNEFANAGAAKLEGDLGSVVYIGKGSNNGSTFDFSTAANFDGAWQKLEQSASAKFKEGGSLYVADSEVPTLLDKSFTPDGMPADAWDCGKSDKSSLTKIEIDPNSAGHSACESNRDDTRTECWGEGFERGEERVVDDKKRRNAKEFDIEDLNEEE